MKHVFGALKGVSYIPDFLLLSYTQITIPATTNGELCERFASGKEAIRPIIFSHGLSACANYYTAVHHSMAAHGHVVIAVNHQDESCFYTEDKNRKPILFVHKELHCGVPYRQAQINIRSDEILKTIAALKSDNITKALIGSAEARIDMSCYLNFALVSI